MVDILSGLIRRAEDQNLQFAGDMILFCEARKDYIRNLRNILSCFERISGLKVNLGKCKVVGLNISEQELNNYAHLLGCEKESWPLKYLELLVGGNPSSAEF